MFITIRPGGELIRYDSPARADTVRAQVGPPGFDIVRIRTHAGPRRETLCAFVNDEGFSQGLARNPVGACVILSLGASAQIYAGPIVVTGWNAYANGPEIADLTPGQVALIERVHAQVSATLGEDGSTAPEGSADAGLRDYAEHVLTAPAPTLTWVDL